MPNRRRLPRRSRRCGPDLIFDDMRNAAGAAGDERTGSAKRPRRCASERYVCAVDVGTGSARAGILDGTGRLFGRAEHPIVMNQPKPDHAEHDSEDVWRAVCRAVQGALVNSRRRRRPTSPASPSTRPARWWCAAATASSSSVSTGGGDRWDTIVWLDHRALDEADACTATGHRVLDYLGGVMSPEMQTPKLMWLKKQSAGNLGARRRVLRPHRFPDLEGVRLERPLAMHAGLQMDLSGA